MSEKSVIETNPTCHFSLCLRHIDNLSYFKTTTWRKNINLVKEKILHEPVNYLCQTLIQALQDSSVTHCTARYFLPHFNTKIWCLFIVSDFFWYLKWIMSVGNRGQNVACWVKVVQFHCHGSFFFNFGMDELLTHWQFTNHFAETYLHQLWLSDDQIVCSMVGKLTLWINYEQKLINDMFIW